MNPHPDAHPPPPDWQQANREYLVLRLEALEQRVRLCVLDGKSSAEPDRELQSSIAAAREKAIAARRPPALDLLSSLFGLTALEQDVLLLSVAPDIDDRFAELLASAVDPRRGRGSMALAFAPRRNGAGTMPALDALLPGRPLRRFALVDSRETAVWRC